jgi:hypothetical protein
MVESAVRCIQFQISGENRSPSVLDGGNHILVKGKYPDYRITVRQDACIAILCSNSLDWYTLNGMNGSLIKANITIAVKCKNIDRSQAVEL